MEIGKKILHRNKFGRKKDQNKMKIGLLTVDKCNFKRYKNEGLRRCKVLLRLR